MKTCEACRAAFRPREEAQRACSFRCSARLFRQEAAEAAAPPEAEPVTCIGMALQETRASVQRMLREGRRIAQGGRT